MYDFASFYGYNREKSEKNISFYGYNREKFEKYEIFFVSLQLRI